MNETLKHTHAAPELNFKISAFEQNLPEAKEASICWTGIQDKLKEILGAESYEQWISDLLPLGIIEESLIIQAKTRFDSYWIKNHYEELINALLDFQRKGLSIYFIFPGYESSAS